MTAPTSWRSRSRPTRPARPLTVEPKTIEAARPLDPLADEAARATGGVDLRRRLMALDAGCIGLAWTIALGVGKSSGRIDPGIPKLVAVVILLVALGVLLTNAFGLYRSRVSAIRSVTIERQALLSGALAGVVWGIERVGRPYAPVIVPLVGGLLMFVVLVLMRPCFDAWVTLQRRRGMINRPIVLVGGLPEVAELAELLSGHPELGYRPAGYVSDGPSNDPRLATIAWLGRQSRATEAVLSVRATGAVIAANGISSADLNPLIRDLHTAGVHVHLSSGLLRMDHRRVRQLPMAHEPFFYLEPNSPRRGALALKRAMDIVGALLVLFVTAPITLLAAACIKLGDRGPVIFRQVRIGHNGEQVVMRKFRTMTVDAETRVEALRSKNARTGPLFKVDDDPRVTRVGRWLRASSIDELPQLINVLEGTLSLVGPRPALPSEVAQFDQELLGRQVMRPGITGLWQVEARHNPSFYAYRHLDLFYVENWSAGLDVAILVATIKVLMGDSLDALDRVRDRRRPAEPADTITLTDTVTLTANVSGIDAPHDQPGSLQIAEAMGLNS